MTEEQGGIYILQTYGPEFRVAYSDNIDLIYGPIDDTGHWTGNKTELYAQFCGSAVYLDMEEALDKASELAYDHSCLEDGISLITDFKTRHFESF